MLKLSILDIGIVGQWTGMSAIGYKRTFCHALNYVGFTPESGHRHGKQKGRHLAITRVVFGAQPIIGGGSDSGRGAPLPSAVQIVVVAPVGCWAEGRAERVLDGLI